MKPRRNSLIRELLAIIVAGILGISLLLSLVFITEMRSMSNQNMEVFIRANNAHLRDQIISQLRERANLLEFTIENSLPLIKRAAASEDDRIALQNYFEKMAKMLPNVLSIFGSSYGRWNDPGQFFCSGDGWYPEPDYDNTIRSWFTTGKASQDRIALTDPYFDMVTKTITLALTKTAFDEGGTPVAVLAEDISINTLDQMANTESSIQKIKSYILHSSGRYISNPDSAAIMEKDFFADHGVEKYRNQILSSDSFFAADSEMVICSDPIFMADWTLVSVISADVVFAEANSTTKISVILGVVCIIPFLAFLTLFVRNLIKPINVVSNELREISEGEGDLTKVIHVKSNNEIGDLTRSFNLTLEKIKNLVITIKNQAAALFAVGSELSVNMSETATAVNEIDATIYSLKERIIKLSRGIAESDQDLENIAGTIEKLSIHVDSQESGVNQSSDAVKDIIVNIDSVTETLGMNMESVNNLADASEIGKTGLQEVSMDIQEIARESEGLLEINSVMENIASQTNLLSMNAAIEAAHAGEAGKGFAVVADEIRKLAESSGEQSKTISGVLKKIKDSIDKITRSTAGVLDKFEVIDLGVKTVSDQVGNIRNAMGEQNVKGRQIMKAISSLTDITHIVKSGASEMAGSSKKIIHQSENLKIASLEISNGISEIAVGIDQINTTVSRVNSISEENKKDIDILTEEVARFKL